MPEFVTISHDPYARVELVRRTVQTNIDCAWCGQKRKAGLFEYGTTRDDDRLNRPNWHRGLFCSKPCHDAYHG